MQVFFVTVRPEDPHGEPYEEALESFLEERVRPFGGNLLQEERIEDGGRLTVSVPRRRADDCFWAMDGDSWVIGVSEGDHPQ